MKINAPVYPDDVEDWLWQTTAHGAKGIWFFSYYVMNQGYESGGYGMTLLDGTITDRAVRAGKVASVLTSNSLLFAQTQVLTPKIGILYNKITYLSGGATEGVGNYNRQAMQGIFSSLFYQNIPTSFVHSDDIVKNSSVPFDIL